MHMGMLCTSIIVLTTHLTTHHHDSALWVFLEEHVDAVVLEVGIGGRLDATNCVPPPLVTAVTPLGFDHMELLGNTLRVGARTKFLMRTCTQ